MDAEPTGQAYALPHHPSELQQILENLGPFWAKETQSPESCVLKRGQAGEVELENYPMLRGQGVCIRFAFPKQAIIQIFQRRVLEGLQTSTEI